MLLLVNAELLRRLLFFQSTTKKNLQRGNRSDLKEKKVGKNLAKDMLQILSYQTIQHMKTWKTDVKTNIMIWWLLVKA